jgi:hypothetical protein
MTDATVDPNPPLAANSARSFNSLGSMTCIVAILSVEETRLLICNNIRQMRKE